MVLSKQARRWAGLSPLRFFVLCTLFVMGTQTAQATNPLPPSPPPCRQVEHGLLASPRLFAAQRRQPFRSRPLGGEHALLTSPRLFAVGGDSSTHSPLLVDGRCPPCPPCVKEGTAKGEIPPYPLLESGADWDGRSIGVQWSFWTPGTYRCVPGKGSHLYGYGWPWGTQDPDGVAWAKYAGNPVLEPASPAR